MPHQNKQRRPWTPEQDEALIYLREEMKIAKWPQIAKEMYEKFRLEGRTEKQCRDRYVNFLRNADNSYIWKVEDQNKLTKLYYELGNRWSEISIHFPKTNGIFIKNKFYSRLRKAIRHLNLIIQTYFPESYSKFSFDIIFKIVNISNKKSKLIQSFEIKEILQSNPKIFEDIIVKMIQMTNSNTKNNLKRKKIQRISSKDQTMWRKLIEILKYLEKEVEQIQSQQCIQKDLHLQTHHFQSFRHLGNMGIKALLGYPNDQDILMQQKDIETSNPVQASYIQLEGDHTFNPERKKQKIIIISDRKKITFEQCKYQQSTHEDLSKKEDTLTIYEINSFSARKMIQDENNGDILGNKLISEMPQQINAVIQP